MSLTKDFKGLSEVAVGGVKCPCCNSYHGKEKPKLFRKIRRKAKQNLKKEMLAFV